MKVPKLRLRIVHARAYCGRDGCDEIIGTDENPTGGQYLDIRLEPKRGEGWTFLRRARGPFPHVDSGPLFEGPSAPLEWIRKRRRRPNPAIGGPSTSNGAIATTGQVVVCPNPQCGTRQIVPSR